MSAAMAARYPGFAAGKGAFASAVAARYSAMGKGGAILPKAAQGVSASLGKGKGKGSLLASFPKASAAMMKAPSAEKMKDMLKDSKKLKRLLNETSEESGGLRQAKRRKIGEDGEDEPAEDDDKENGAEEDSDDDDEYDPEEREQRKQYMDDLVKRWLIAGKPASYAVKFVLSDMTTEEMQKIVEGNWKPNNDGNRSSAEQLHNHLLKSREAAVNTGERDPVSVFASRWGISKADETAKLRTLSYDVLVRVIDAYDASLSLDEEIEGATASVENDPSIEKEEEDEEEEEYDENGDVKPKVKKERPKGWQILSRFSKLELIPPDADALVCGDANLTFSTRLAKHRKSLGHVGIVVATTFENRATLRERYKDIDQIIANLESLGAVIMHEVDCTRLSVDERFEEYRHEGRQFGSAYYNYPHAGAVRGYFDGQPFVNWRHLNLMTLFFRALRSVVRPNAQVRVSSNANATGVRSAGIIMSAEASEFIHAESVQFHEWVLHRYNRAYGDKRDAKRERLAAGENYRQQGAAVDMVYTFFYNPTVDYPPDIRLILRYPPDFKTLFYSSDVCACGMITEAERRAQRMAMQERMSVPHFTGGPHRQLEGDEKHAQVLKLYQRFASEVSGCHVG